MPSTKKTRQAKDLLDQIQTLGSSIVYLAKDTSDSVIADLEDNGFLTGDDGQELAKDIKNDYKKKKDRLYNNVIKHMRRVVDDLGIATKTKKNT